jgi:hypothetical protein
MIETEREKERERGHSGQEEITIYSAHMRTGWNTPGFSVFLSL